MARCLVGLVREDQPVEPRLCGHYRLGPYQSPAESGTTLANNITYDPSDP